MKRWIHLALLLPRFRMERTQAEHPGLELAINLRSAEDIHLTVTERTG